MARVDALLAAIRDRESKAKIPATERLDEETEIDLSLLEVLDDLEEGEAEDATEILRRRNRAETRPEEAEQHRVLDYSTFLSGRAIRAERSALSRDSLAGTDQAFVRAFLNRVLGIEAPQNEVEDAEDADFLRKAFDLGDEVEDAETAIEGGESFESEPNAPRPPRPPAELEKEAERRKAIQRRTNRERIAAAVGVLRGRMRERAEGGGLTTNDLLRVRAILSIVAAAGWAGNDAMRAQKSNVVPKSARQVLPMTGSDDRWPRLFGVTLHALFGGEHPAVRHLKIDVIHDQMPDDVLECWATCFWTGQAAAAASVADHSSPVFVRSLTALLDRVYRLTGLTAPELLSDEIADVMNRLGTRYANRLGVDATVVMANHKRMSVGLGRAL